MLCLTIGRPDQNGVVACTHLCLSLGRTHDADAVLGPVEEISPPMIVAGSMMPFPPTFLSRRRVEAQTRAGKPCADSGQVIRDVDIDKTWANRLWLSPGLAFDTADALGRQARAGVDGKGPNLGSE